MILNFLVTPEYSCSQPPEYGGKEEARIPLGDVVWNIERCLWRFQKGDVPQIDYVDDKASDGFILIILKNRSNLFKPEIYWMQIWMQVTTLILRGDKLYISRESSGGGHRVEYEDAKEEDLI